MVLRTRRGKEWLILELGKKRLVLFGGCFELPIFLVLQAMWRCVPVAPYDPYPNGSFDLQVMQRVSFSLTALDLRMVRQGYF